jgi:hypothetical protein
MRSTALFRSVNTQTHGAKHRVGGDFRTSRKDKDAPYEEGHRTSMHGKIRRGRDYTPLFRFLLSKVGEPWGEIFAEAKARLDTTEPVFWLVARSEPERSDFVRTGESSYFSGMYIDTDNRLQLVNPGLRPEDMRPSCTCCMHTLNGVRLGKSPGSQAAAEQGSRGAA